MTFTKKWVQAAKPKDFNLNQLAYSIYALAHLKHHDVTFVTVWIHVAKNRVCQFQPDQLIDSTLALVPLNYYDLEFVNAATLRLRFLNQDLHAHIIYELARSNQDNQMLTTTAVQKNMDTSSSCVNIVKPKKFSEAQFNSYDLYPLITFANKVTICAKSVSTVIDVARAVVDPTSKNILEASLQSVVAYGLYKGIPAYMLAPTIVEVGYKVSDGDYVGALSPIGMTMGFMILMSKARHEQYPVLSFVATAAVAMSSVIKALNNGYQLYNEWSQKGDTNTEKSEIICCPKYNDEISESSHVCFEKHLLGEIELLDICSA